MKDATPMPQTDGDATTPVGHKHPYVVPRPTLTLYGRLMRMRRTHGARLLGAIGGAVLIAAFVLVVAFAPRFLVDPAISDPAAKTSAENDARQTIIQALGGLALLVGAMYTARTFATTAQRQITERFSEAVQLLGDSRLHVRVGAVFALERIPIDSKRDYPAIVALLVSFIHGSRGAPPEDQPIRDVEHSHGVDEAVQAALTVLGRRKHRELEDDALRLNAIDLRGARLDDLDFSMTDFTYSNLSGAIMTNGNFESSRFSWANVSNAGIIDTNLKGASFVAADLSGSYLCSADCQNVDFRGANLRGADFGARWADDGAKITEAARVRGAHWDEAVFSNTQLSGVDLSSTSSFTADQARGAIINDFTKLPPSVVRSELGPRPPVTRKKGSSG